MDKFSSTKSTRSEQLAAVLTEALRVIEALSETNDQLRAQISATATKGPMREAA